MHLISPFVGSLIDRPSDQS